MIMCRDPLESVAKTLTQRLASLGYSIVGNPRVRDANADISFCLSSTSNEYNNNLFEETDALDYPLPIGDITLRKNVIYVNLDRRRTFEKILPETLLPIDCPRKELSINHDVGASEEDLTTYRVLLLAQTLKNLSSVLNYKIVENSPVTNLYLSSKSNFSQPLHSNQTLVICGSVLNSISKNKETLTTVSHIKSSKKKILLQEMEDRNKMNEEIAMLLVDAVLKFDLLCVKVSKNVLLTSKIDSGASGSVVFILYNYSRLNAILHEYESRVSRCFYPPLPSIEDIDFSVLKKEEEWKLIRDYVMRFPTVILDTMKHIDEGKPAPHLLCQFLYSLARAISSYYRSTKVLLDKQPCLMKLTFARIHLIKNIHRILHQGLEILNIKAIPAL